MLDIGSDAQYRINAVTESWRPVKHVHWQRARLFAGGLGVETRVLIIIKIQRQPGVYSAPLGTQDLGFKPSISHKA